MGNAAVDCKYKNLTKEPLVIFLDRLPKKPFCSDDLNYGIKPLIKELAKKYKYIQPNGSTHKYWLVFDIDRVDAVELWKEVDAPPPSIIVYNRDNGRGHYLYCLETSVRTAPDGSTKALNYAAAVEYTLKKRLGADMSYAGLITKNPLHQHFYTWVGERVPYTLDWLASYFDKLDNPPRKRTDDEAVTGLGRNCTLFYYGRRWAYRAVRKYWQPNYYQTWLKAVEDYLNELNEANCEPPLPYNEVKHTAKSIAKYTHANFTPKGFSQEQAKRGSKGGKVGSKEDKARAGSKGGKMSKGGGRPDKKALLPRVIEMKVQGYNQRAIAEDLGISLGTVNNWLKQKN